LSLYKEVKDTHGYRSNDNEPLLGTSGYSGGRDQEDHTLKPAWANSLQDPISKNTYHKKKKKKGWWSGSRYRLSVQVPVLQKKKKGKIF
jgi:hypothetical protein